MSSTALRSAAAAVLVLAAMGAEGVTNAVTPSAGPDWSCTSRWLNPDPGMGDGFGSAVAAVGGEVWIGAPFDDDAGADAGAVYVFTQTGDLVAKLLPPPGILAATWGRVIVAAPDQQRVAVMTASDLQAAWQASLHDGDGALIQTMRALDGQDLFTHQTRAAIGEQFVVFGAPGGERKNTAYDHSPPDHEGHVRVYGAATGELVADLRPHGPPERRHIHEAFFGTAVATTRQFVAIADSWYNLPGKVWVYSLANPAEPRLVGTLASPGPSNGFGRGLATDGQSWFVGVSGSGGVHAFDVATLAHQWYTPKPLPDDAYDFGHTLQPWRDHLIVAHGGEDALSFGGGAPAYAVTLLDRRDGSIDGRIEPADPVARREFGWAAAGLPDGLLIGVPGDTTATRDAGSVHAFRWASEPNRGCQYGSEIVPCRALTDWDGDGLSWRDETAAGLDPCNGDEDADRIVDGLEIHLGIDPQRGDTDRDGLMDFMELQQHGTDPRRADTDGDQSPDRVELVAGTDPRDPLSFPLPVNGGP